jgi:hypothetical protein
MTTIRISKQTRDDLNTYSKNKFHIPFEHVSKDFLLKTILKEIKLTSSHTLNNK